MSGTARILVVDDHLELLEFLRYALKDRYAVATAVGVEEGLRHLSNYSVNLVLLDFRMPAANGVSALREIKTRYADTEVILMTAYAPVEVIQEAFRLGAFAFLMKPFNIDNLINTIEEALRNQALSRTPDPGGIRRSV